MRVLFVCTGNICRSPTAEGVARHLVADAGLEKKFEFDSAGVEGFHVGQPPDPRTQRVALARGYDLSRLRARRLHPKDFHDFDLILAMDSGHLKQMLRICPENNRYKVKLFTKLIPSHPFEDVPDPYYGGEKGFETVLDLCEQVLSRWLARYTVKHAPPQGLYR
jgi:protein-tyrosine phosphatase